MNLFKKISISITLVLSIFGLIGCGESNQKYIDKIEEITITFETNGGSEIYPIVINQALIDSIDPEAISDVTFEDLDYLLPTKDGFLFDGWYLDEALENKLTIDNPIIEEYLNVFETEDNIKIDIKLYVKWKIDDSIQNYTVTYHLDGGTNHEDNIVSFTKSDPSFLLKEPTKDGYTFLGWYSDNSYNNSVASIDTSKEINYDLYAKWELIDKTIYTITYHLDGGSNDPENLHSYSKNDNDIPLLAPTKTGYTFMGWYTDSEFTNEISIIDTDTLRNYDLYAKWGDLSMFIFTLVGNEYKIQGNNIDFSGTLVIPDTFNGKPVTMIADGGFLMYEGITNIVFGKNIHTIGSGAFTSCKSLTSLVIPDQVVRIESGAFEYCDNLESVIIGDGVTYIGGFAFNSNGNLSTVTLGSSVTYIGRQAFSHLEKLTSINLPDGLETIEEYAFFNCPKLDVITIPETVTFIGQYTFHSCNPLTIMLSTTYVPTTWHKSWNISDCEVVLKGETPSETYYLTYYLDGGVNGDTNPTSYKGDVEIILSNPTKEGYLFIGWFSDATFTTEITNIPVGYNQNITLYAKWEENNVPSYLEYQEYDTFVVITGLNNDSITEIIIPEMYRGKPVTTIGENAFYYKQNITSVVLPNTITTIEKGAFLAARSLNSINFPSSLTTIGDYAFSATGFTEMVLPSTITSYGEELFYNCDNLTSVTLPDNMEVIPKRMFAECESLITINIPISVHTIEDEAFTGCMALPSIDLLHVTMIGYAAFSNCQSLQEIILSDDLTIIEDYAFAYTESVTNIELPENLEIIGIAAFSGCNKVGVIEFPDTLKHIGESAFWACRLTEISLPSSLISIGEHAFRYNNFTTLYLPDSLVEIELLAFRDCDKLLSVYLPTSIPYVEERIFRDTGYSVTLYLDSDSIPETWATEWKDYFRGQTVVLNVWPTTSILYDIDGGINHQNNINTINSNNSLVLSNPIKEGYYFDGWYLEDTFETKITSIKQHTGDSITIYAKWMEDSPSTHSITYHVEGGYLKDNHLTYYTEEDNTTLLSPTKAGYQFVGWYLEDTYSTLVTSLESFTTDVDLYALFEEDYLLYEEYDDHVAVVGLKQPLYDVVIPASYNGKPVTTIGAHAFEYETSVISITLPNTITTIEDYAITADNLRSINLEEGITSIGDYAFSGANDLESITIPSTVTFMGTNVFYSCNSLKDVEFLNTLTEITDGMFANCESLETFIIPDTVTSIGVDAFRGCDALAHVIIPSSVTSIGAYAFSYTDSLTSIDIPTSVIEIGNSAFRESGLTSLVIPDTVTTVGSEIWYYSRFLQSIYIGKEFNGVLSSNDFVGLTLLEEINVHPENTVYNSIDGVLYGNFDQYTLIKYPIKKAGSSYTIQDGTIIIERQAFTETTLSEIIIPNSVTTIGYSAFSSNKTMKSIYIPSSVVTMESSVFYSNNHLKIYVSHDVAPATWDSYWTDQSNEVFYSVDQSDIAVYQDVIHYIIVDDHVEVVFVTPVIGVTINIDIPNEINNLPVTTIHSYAFVNLNVKVIIPSTVTTIHKYAFYSTNGTVYTDYSSKPLLWDDTFHTYGITVTYDAIWFKMDSLGGNYSFPIVGSTSDLKPIGRGWIPVRQGYIFDGWYTDINCTPGNEFTFTQFPGTEDIMPSTITIIYAKWVLEE